MPTPLPHGYPAHLETPVTLHDGSQVYLRPIMPADGPLLVNLFNEISPQTRYLRFLGHLPALSEQMLRDFTEVDYITASALVAVIREDGADIIIAVSRYSLDPEQRSADLAVTVRDDWQHRGLGKVMLARIVEIGKEHGIGRFVSLIDPENSVVRKILSDLGYQVSYLSRDGALQVEIMP